MLIKTRTISLRTNPGSELPSDERFLRCLEAALDQYGESFKSVLYYKLKNDYGISRTEIPKKIDILVAGIDSFFGVGAHIVYGTIIWELQRSVGKEITLDEHDVKSAMREALHYFESEATWR